jgi:dGTPase
MRRLIVLHPRLEAGRRAYETTRRLITWSIEDMLTATAAAACLAWPAIGQKTFAVLVNMVACHSEAFAAERAELAGFLFRRMYRHPRVDAIMHSGRRESFTTLFSAFFDDPAQNAARLVP